MEFRKQKSIYHQIADLLSDRILASEWKQGERMASVRDVAEQLSVNPNTVLRAFDLLQESGIIFNRRGVGYFVADEYDHKPGAPVFNRIVTLKDSYKPA